MVWGEKNTIDFFDWADQCQNDILRKKSINVLNNYNFANDKSSNIYKTYKNIILNTIQNYKSISVQQLYNVLPNEIISNPTIKHIILQLYFEDNLMIRGQKNNINDKEINFVLVFVKNNIKTQKINENYVRKQSNIEDLIDNNWSTSGRKLEFEQKILNEKKELNINLRKNTTVLEGKVIEKSQNNVENNLKDDKHDVVIESTQKKENFIIEDNNNSNIKYIKIDIPKKEIIKELKIEPKNNNISKIEKNKENLIIEENEFGKLSAYELYFLEAFLNDAMCKENNKKDIKILKNIVSVKGNINYLIEKEEANIFIKILKIIGILTIIGIPFVIISQANKTRKKAFKDYRRELKISSYSTIKNRLKNNYNNIINF